jgi:diguanylate cyclase (GGDEF)-like protein/PAS domain S-box-containing protein
MDIDIRTVVLFYLVANALNGGLIFLIWQIFRKHYRGLFHILINMTCQTAGSLFLLLRGVIPDFLSILATSVFSVTGMIFALKGLERFFNKEKRRIYNYVFTAIFLLLIVYFTFINDSMLARNICTSGMLLLITVQACKLLFRDVEGDFRQIARFTAIISLAYAILSVGRIFLLILSPMENNDFYASGIVNSISMIIYGSLNILYTAAIIMMVSQRMLNEVQTEKDKYNKAFNSSSYSLILTKALDGKIFEVNEGFVEMTGYTPEEVLGKTTLEVGFWVDPAERTEFVNELASGDVHGKEVQFRIKNGVLITCLISASKIMALGEECILTSVNDITEMVLIKEKFQIMALHDTLTGLPNRQLLYDRAGVALANAQREKSMVAVISLDVDRLKSINDQWGHVAGDLVLVTVSGRIFSLLRKGDTVARFGGDEFIILLSGINRAEDINAIIQRIVEVVAEPILFEENQITVSASAGIALFPNDEEEIEALIRKSDEAMYYIKEHGRDGFVFFRDIG